MECRSYHFKLSLLLALLIFPGSYLSSQSVSDYDGNRYPVIRAGHLWWTAENLRVKHDPDGNPLSCFEVENPYLDKNPYGMLYSWATAMDSSMEEGARGICPQGWHIPTDAEWDSLMEWAGGVNQAGKTLMENGSDGFGALIAGNYNPIQDVHSYFGEEAYFWTSSSYNHYAAWMRNLGKPKKNINRSTVRKHYGFSVRCVKPVY